MSRLFDAYIMVDWSAAAKPATGANSVWIGILARDARLKFQFRAVNADTRPKATTFLLEMIEKLNRRGDKVLLGFDFSLGYPAGTADAAGFDAEAGKPWQALSEFIAERLREREGNGRADDRFAVAASLNYRISGGPFPFWGAMSQRHQSATLAQKKPVFSPDRPVREYRIAEETVRQRAGATPKSVWQLGGQGSVGSQTLMGLPHVLALRHKLPNAHIWPFETGLKPLDEDALASINVLIAEIYPSMINVRPAAGETLDAAQVHAIARHFCDLDDKSRLGALFSGPENLDPGRISQIEDEEGWILGA